MEFTPSRLAELSAYTSFWRQQVVSTEPVNRLAAETAIRQLYRALNRPEPGSLLWFESPREAGGAAHALLLEQDPEFFARYWGNLVLRSRTEWERIRAAIVSQLNYSGWDGAKQALIPPPFGDGTCRVGFAFLARALRDAGPAPWLPFGKRYFHFMSAVEDQSICTKEDRRREIEQYQSIRKVQEETDPLRLLQEDVDEIEWKCFYSSPGFHPAYVVQASADGLTQWPDPAFQMRGISFGQLARLDFLAKECGESFPPGYLALLDVARQINLWWALDKVAVLCDRPQQLSRNSAGQLHHSEGPAMVYPNGWRVYSVNGERVDPVAVTPPEQITFELIRNNRLFKKILVERYGKARYRAEAAERKRIKPPVILSARLPADAGARLDYLLQSSPGQLRYHSHYMAGDRVGVWNELTGLGERARSAEHAADALAVAYTTMERAAHNVKLLIETLNRLQYEFTGEGHTPPSAQSRKDWRKVESKIGALPLSLRAWWDVVGAVDLTGDHDLLSARSGLESPALGSLLTDPLVVYGPEVTLSEHEESMREEGNPPESVLAADRYHKHDISGGCPYAMALPSRVADDLLLHEANQLHFVDYLRLCFRYGGFPGFHDDVSKIPAREMALLTHDLLEI